MCFPVNIANIFRAPVLKNIYEQLLLKFKQNPWKVHVKESRRSCSVNLKACNFFYQAGLSNMNCFTGFAKTITFLFYIF